MCTKVKYTPLCNDRLDTKSISKSVLRASTDQALFLVEFIQNPKSVENMQCTIDWNNQTVADLFWQLAKAT